METEYTTKSGYTYKFLPNGYTNDDQVKDILETAAKFKQMRVTYIDALLKRRLEQDKGLGLTSLVSQFGKDSCRYEYAFFQDLCMGSCFLIDKPLDMSGSLLILNMDEAIENDLFERLNAFDNLIYRDGLNSLLDPNAGGFLNQNSMELASTIIY